MPSPRYTRIEITTEAYLALEAEAVLQGKTLKKLASEMILNEVSDKALDFIHGSGISLSRNTSKSGNPKVTKVIEKIGTTGVHADKTLLKTIQEILRKEGYVQAMLYVAQHTASIERDELHRIISVCDQHRLSPDMAADVIKDLLK
jgi:hypothetical protein